LRVKEPFHPKCGSVEKRVFTQQRSDRIQVSAADAVNFALALGHNETVDWALRCTFVGGLEWVPFWYGSNDVFGWGTVLFPGLALIIFEVSLLVRGARHPVGIKEIQFSALLIVIIRSITAGNVPCGPTLSDAVTSCLARSRECRSLPSSLPSLSRGASTKPRLCASAVV
jgi:hypothetical protein